MGHMSAHSHSLCWLWVGTGPGPSAAGSSWSQWGPTCCGPPQGRPRSDWINPPGPTGGSEHLEDNGGHYTQVGRTTDGWTEGHIHGWMDDRLMDGRWEEYM